MADAAGCTLVLDAGPGLAAAARAARAPWILALPAGLVPGGAWMDDVAETVAAARPAAFTLRTSRGSGARLRAVALNAAASLAGRAHRDLGLVAPREALLAGGSPRVSRMASPLHDRRGPRGL